MIANEPSRAPRIERGFREFRMGGPERLRALALALGLVAVTYAPCSARAAPMTPPASPPAASVASTRPAAEAVIVVCAPGYPGNTAQAQPTMDAFAAQVAASAGLGAGKLGAIYFETEKGGLDSLAGRNAALALVPLPFWLEHHAKLHLEPRLMVERESGATETWTLVAKRGAVGSPAALDGWEIVGLPGYAPAFVKGVALRGWGSVPVSTKVSFSPSALGAMRRAATGEKVAVILDAEQAAALPSTPFAKELETLTTSPALPASVVCAVADHLPAAKAAKLVESLAHLHEKPEAAEVLKTMRMKRFVAADAAAIDKARAQFDDSAKAAR